MAFPKPLLFPLVVALLSLLLFHTLYTKKSFSQSENHWKHVSTSEAVGMAYELQKQIFELRQEMEMQRKRSLEVETRAKIADKKVAELNSKLENVDVKWSLSKLGLNPNKTREYLMTIWNQHLSQTLQKIPSVKDDYVTFTISLKPTVQYITNKSIEVFYTSKQALTPHFVQGFNVSYYYHEVRPMTIAKPHLEKVQVALEPYTENLRYGFEKLVNSTKIFGKTK